MQTRVFRFRGWRMILGLVLAWLAFGTAARAADPQITSLTAAQRADTKLVDITYTLTDADSPTVTVSVEISTNNGASYDLPASSFSGNGYGGTVTPGTGKQIVWNAGTDWNGQCSDKVCFKVTADDGTIPGDYMVIGLSAGPSASGYPVSYLAAVPPGGWTNEYKTTNLVMRRIPAGTFIMGAPTNELGSSSQERQHHVTLTRDFYIGVFEVTQKQWERVMGNWPSYFTNNTYRDARPVEEVSYLEIRENPDNTPITPNWPQSSQVHPDSFMGKLRTKTGLTTLDLPTEAQWEYACRAGTTNALNSGKDLTDTSECSNVAEVARYFYNGILGYGQECGTNAGTATVGSYMVNQWGLYDMHGNVWEWRLDWWQVYSGAVTNPVGSETHTFRGDRGGGWATSARECRSAYRRLYDPSDRSFERGFRVTRTMPCLSAECGPMLVDTLGLPRITVNPQSVTNNIGTAAGFTVTATGAAPLYYQWQKNTVDIGLATNATYTIASVVANDAGGYRCLVSNVLNVATSAVATLTVNKLSQSIFFHAIPTQHPTNKVTLSAMASSGLPVSFAVASGPGSIAAGVLSFSGTGVVRVVASQAGNAAFAAAAPVTNAVSVSKTAQTITFPAIPAQNPTNKVTLSATASSGLPVSFSLASGPGSIAAGLLSFSGTGVVRVVASQAGDAAFNAAKPVTNQVTVTVSGSVINDYDGDGRSDLAVYDNNIGYWYAYSLQKGQATVWAVAWGWPGAETVPGDYDGDAIGDLCVYDQNTGYWFAWSQARQAAILWAQPWGWPGAETVPGDYDGDAKSDMAVYDQNTGYWYVTTVSGATLVWATPWGWPGAKTVPGDYDGDGRSDLCVYDSNTGYWYILTVNRSILAWATPWGWPGATTVPGDYDGDGVSDLCVYDQPTGAWFVWSIAKNRLVVWGMSWGWTGAVPVPGDYDGDGKNDLAVFDTIQGNWYIWSVANNSNLAWQQSWGWPGAYPPGGRQ